MGASLIDDSFFNAVDADPLICVSKSTSIAAIVFDEFALYSMDVNSEKGRLNSLWTLLVLVPNKFLLT